MHEKKDRSLSAGTRYRFKIARQNKTNTSSNNSLSARFSPNVLQTCIR